MTFEPFERPYPTVGPPSISLLKPPVPYIPGWKFTAKSHIPSAPTPVIRGATINSRSEREERFDITPFDRCLRHPPLPGEEGRHRILLEVLHVLKGGDGHQSQVFTVRLLDSDSTSQSLPQEGTTLVAKVYDPLYFDDDDGYINPFICMDRHYTHEANAYSNLAEFQGHWIPKYYGSYTLIVDTRVVRMILIEYIEGTTMVDARPEEFSQAYRQSVMKSIVDLESRVYEKDLFLRDLEPRNAIIRLPTSDPPNIVFIDFADALFNRRWDDTFALNYNYFLGEYISPLLRWRTANAGRKINPFKDWIDWDWDPWLQVEFAHTAVTITPAMQERWSDD